MAIDNIEIAKQLKKLQEELNSLVEAQTKSLRSQLDVSRQMVESVGQMTNNSSETVDNLQKQQEFLEKAAESAQKMGSKGVTAKFAEALKKSHKSSDGLAVSLKKTVKMLPGFAAFAGIWSGFTAGIMGTVNSLKLFGSTTLTALEALGQLAISVISFPFKILSNLINFASQGGGDNGLRQALEDIRKEFGDLHKSSSAAIISIARGMKGELANTGISVYRTFGRLAERLKTIAEYAKNMGAAFANVSRQFVENGEVIGAYIKGLHFTEDGQKALAARSQALGVGMAELSRQVANYSVQLADEFGQSAAQVSQDVGDMMSDFEHFGGMAPQVLSQISVYARRLGVEMKGLLGIVDQFDNFEGAATSAAQLTQAFGLQLDALQLLKAQDPAERTELIRKSFFAAGRSVENMTRQERALLAAQTGLEASTLDLVFSAKNQGLSYDQVKKKSEGARKSQLTQAESLQKIAGAIERLVRSGSMGGGGFFERFFQGFERGIIRTTEFRKLMINIRIALRQTYLAGMEVGRAFVRLFPGIQQLLGGLQDLFDRNRFREMTKSLRTIFRDFFTSLTSTSGRDSFKNLMDRLKAMFWNYFNGSTPAGRGILEGVRKFSKAASVIIAGMVREAAKGVTAGIHFISDLLSGRKSLTGGSAAKGALGFVTDLLEPIIGALKEAWPPLVEALTQLWEEEIWPRARDFLVSHAGTIATVLFGPALLRALAGGIAGAVGGAFVKGLTQGLTSAVAEVAASGTTKSVVTKALTGMFKGASTAATASVGQAGATAAAATGNPAANPAATANMLRIGAFIAVGMLAVVTAIAILAEYMRARDLTPTQMFTAAGVVAAAGGVMLELAGVVLIASAAGEAIKAAQAGFLVGMAAIGVIAVALGLGIPLIVDSLSGFTPQQLTSSMQAMAAGAVFIAAAAGILVVAAAIGAGIAATGGAALAAAGAGMLAIGATLGLMVIGIRQVIKSASEISVPPDFDRKFDIFSKALGAILDFGQLITDIASSSSSGSLRSWITGSGPDDQIDVLVQLNRTMASMSTIMTQLVSNVLAQVRSLSAAPEDLKKAEIFGTVMTAISGMMSSLAAPSALLSGSGGILSSLIGSDLAGNLSNYSIFIENMGVSLGNLIRDIMGSFGNILSSGGGTFTDSSLKAFEVIGNILTVVGTMGRNLISIVNSQFAGLDSGQLRERAAVVGEVVGTMMASIFTGGGSGGLISAVSQLMTQLVSSLGDLSATDARKLTTFGPVLVAAFGAIGSIASAVADISAMVSSMPAAAQGEALGTVNVIVQNMLSGVQGLATSLLNSIRDVFGDMSAGRVASLTQGVTAFKGMIEAVVQLPSTLKTLYDTLTEGGPENEYPAMMQRLGSMISLFYDRGAGEASLPELFRVVAGAFTGLPEITGDPATKIDMLTKGLSSLNAIREIDFAAISRSIESNAEFIKNESFSSIGTNVRAMVDEVNSIAHDLGAIEAVNINTSLKALAGRLGLGDSEELTIRNRDFTIAVNVAVHIDAQELERTMVDRPNSRIMATKGRAGA